MNDPMGIDDRANDSLSVAPPKPDQNRPDPDQDDAGSDAAIEERLKRDPESEDATLDRALDESMDASDPPSNTRPGGDAAAPSSGFHDEAERQQDA